jgi:hypothetical protein
MLWIYLPICFLAVMRGFSYDDSKPRVSEQKRRELVPSEQRLQSNALAYVQSMFFARGHHDALIHNNFAQPTIKVKREVTKVSPSGVTYTQLV